MLNRCKLTGPKTSYAGLNCYLTDNQMWVQNHSAPKFSEVVGIIPFLN